MPTHFVSWVESEEQVQPATLSHDEHALLLSEFRQATIIDPFLTSRGYPDVHSALIQVFQKADVHVPLPKLNRVLQIVLEDENPSRVSLSAFLEMAQYLKAISRAPQVVETEDLTLMMQMDDSNNNATTSQQQSLTSTTRSSTQTTKSLISSPTSSAKRIRLRGRADSILSDENERESLREQFCQSLRDVNDAQQKKQEQKMKQRQKMQRYNSSGSNKDGDENNNINDDDFSNDSSNDGSGSDYDTNTDDEDEGDKAAKDVFSSFNESLDSPRDGIAIPEKRKHGSKQKRKQQKNEKDSSSQLRRSSSFKSIESEGSIGGEEGSGGLAQFQRVSSFREMNASVTDFNQSTTSDLSGGGGTPTNINNASTSPTTMTTSPSGGGGGKKMRVGFTESRNTDSLRMSDSAAMFADIQKTRNRTNNFLFSESAVGLLEDLHGGGRRKKDKLGSSLSKHKLKAIIEDHRDVLRRHRNMNINGSTTTSSGGSNASVSKTTTPSSSMNTHRRGSISPPMTGSDQGASSNSLQHPQFIMTPTSTSTTSNAAAFSTPPLLPSVSPSITPLSPTIMDNTNTSSSSNNNKIRYASNSFNQVFGEPSPKSANINISGTSNISQQDRRMSLKQVQQQQVQQLHQQQQQQQQHELQEEEYSPTIFTMQQFNTVHTDFNRFKFSPPLKHEPEGTPLFVRSKKVVVGLRDREEMQLIQSVRRGKIPPSERSKMRCRTCTPDFKPTRFDLAASRASAVGSDGGHVGQRSPTGSKLPSVMSPSLLSDASHRIYGSSWFSK